MTVPVERLWRELQKAVVVFLNLPWRELFGFRDPYAVFKGNTVLGFLVFV